MNTMNTRRSLVFLDAFTLLEPQSRFGDKLLIIREFCPHIWECGSKRVKVSVVLYILILVEGAFSQRVVEPRIFSPLNRIGRLDTA